MLKKLLIIYINKKTLKIELKILFYYDKYNSILSYHNFNFLIVLIIKIFFLKLNIIKKN